MDSFSAELERQDGTRFTVDSTLERDAEGNVRHIGDSHLISDEFDGTAGELTSIFRTIVDFCLVAQEEHPQQVSARETFLAAQANRSAADGGRETAQISEILEQLENMTSGSSASSALRSVENELGLENVALRQALKERFSSVDGHRNVVDSIVWLRSVPKDNAGVDRLYNQLELKLRPVD